MRRRHKWKCPLMPTKMTNNNFCEWDCVRGVQFRADTGKVLRRRGSKGDTERPEKAQWSKKGGLFTV